MQKQFHQYMGHGGGSPPFKGQRTSMQTTIGVGNTIGNLTKQDQGVIDDQAPSLMTLIPIKVSATTLRETPKNSSPPIVMYNNGNPDRSADRQKNKQFLRATTGNERCKYFKLTFNSSSSRVISVNS